jgi:hypothetical protein
MFVPPDIPTSWDVSKCQILCFEPTLIPAIPRLQPKVFTFFPLKKQFNRIRSTVPVQFSPAFNFQQLPAFPSDYDRNQFYLLDQLVWRLGHFPFLDMREFDPQVADKIRQWAEAPPCLHCAAILLQGMPHHFCCQLFGHESETICLLQWTKSCSSTSSNRLIQIPAFPAL